MKHQATWHLIPSCLTLGQTLKDCANLKAELDKVFEMPQNVLEHIGRIKDFSQYSIVTS